jgi:hypothetical protein
LLSISASLVKSESTTAFVSLRASSRCFRFFDRLSVRRKSTIFFSSPANFVPSGEQTSLFTSPFFVFSTVRSHLSLYLSLSISPLSLPSCPSPTCPLPAVAAPTERGTAHPLPRPTAAVSTRPRPCGPVPLLPAMAAVGGRRIWYFCKIVPGILGNCTHKYV